MKQTTTVKKSIGLNLDAKAEMEKTERGFRADISGDTEAFSVVQEIKDDGVKEAE